MPLSDDDDVCDYDDNDAVYCACKLTWVMSRRGRRSASLMAAVFRSSPTNSSLTDLSADSGKIPYNGTVLDNVYQCESTGSSD